MIVFVGYVLCGPRGRGALRDYELEFYGPYTIEDEANNRARKHADELRRKYTTWPCSIMRIESGTLDFDLDDAHVGLQEYWFGVAAHGLWDQNFDFGDELYGAEVDVKERCAYKLQPESRLTAEASR